MDLTISKSPDKKEQITLLKNCIFIAEIKNQNKFIIITSAA
jgi:hypothetical protein